MSIYNKVTNNVADVARKIMEGKQTEVLSEELKGKQHKIDKNKNGKIDAHDFKLLRKEEQEDLDEGKMGQLSADLTDLSHSDFHKEYGKPKSHYDPTNFKKPVQKGKEMDRVKSLAQRGMASVKQEETEQLQEYESVNGVYRHKGTYGTAKGAQYGATDWDAEEKMKDEPAKPARKKYGAHQKRRTNTKLYKEMIESLQLGGIKSLFRTIEEGKIHEEASEEEFNSELADQKAKFDGKKKGADVAAPATQGVKAVKEATHTELQVIDMTNGSEKPYVEIVDLEERELTDAETKKKEEVVKSMKKGLSGFKERYGDRAKEVMYATSTRIAKEKA